MKEKTCPFCKKVLNRYSVSHIYICSDNQLKNKIGSRFEYLKFNGCLLCDFELLNKEYSLNKLSLPKLKDKYGFDFKSILFLLDYFNIQKRTSSEGNILSSGEREKTNLSKYGAKNPLSKNTESYHKRNKTVKDKYNVDNVFQIKEIKELCKKDPKVISEQSKKVWASKTEEEKIKWLHNSMHKNVWSKTKGWSSKIEKRVASSLLELQISYSSQFRVGRFYFDFKVGNILIEVNGDYWHANPKKYKAEDTFWKCRKNSQEIWERDLTKRKVAEEKGYVVIVVWEDEINSCNDDELCLVLLEKIKNA